MTSTEKYLAVSLNTWKTTLERADKLFSGLTEKQAKLEVAPGKNRLIYLMGHLTAVSDRMFEALDLGPRLRPEFDELFLTNPDRKMELPPLVEVKAAWEKVNAELSKKIQALAPEDWLLKHSAVSDEDFAKDPTRNRLAMLLSRTGHVAYHLGQATLAQGQERA